MNENIDLAKILEGCPKGTKFYSPIFGEVMFEEIEKWSGCVIVMEEYGICRFRKNGTYLDRKNAECLLFPSKEQRDWSKFERFWDKSKGEKFDPKTLQPFDKVLTRDFLSEDWMADFFEKIEENDVHYNVTCVTCKWIRCIPYNEETKHLLGTREDCPEYYKWWEE